MRALVLAVAVVMLAGHVPDVRAAPPPDAAALFALGEAEFRAGKIDDAIESFSRGYALEPRPEFLLNLGQCYRALGRRSEAITYFERFIKAAPDHPLRSNAEHTLDELRRAEAIERVALTPKPVPQPPARTEHSAHLWLWVALGATAVIGASVGIYVETRNNSPAVNDTIRLPP